MTGLSSMIRTCLPGALVVSVPVNDMRVVPGDVASSPYGTCDGVCEGACEGEGVGAARERSPVPADGVEEGNDDLIRLNDALDGPLDRLGWSPDPRARRPHLTVARTDALRGEVSHAVANALAAAATGWRTGFDATTLTLYRSHLGGGPPRYEPVVEAPLLG